LTDPWSAAALRASFDSVAGGTVGIEEEIMLLDPGTLELVPRGPQLIARLGDDPRFKLELPASQLEITLGPYGDAGAVAPALHEARAVVARAADGLARPAAAGVHPFSSGIGELNDGERYAHTRTEYGHIATRQLVCALQVHVAVGGAERTLAVYNALRSYLPLIAALAANAPFYEGRDCGLASVRPKLGELLPRQGVPPALDSWEQYADALRWGARSGTFAEPRTWWWELRPHPGFGTLELRVPDAQTSIDDALAVIVVAHALVLWLAARHDAGERMAVAPTWRIEENRWSACRHGTAGTMADLDSGEPRPTREWLAELLAALAPGPARPPRSSTPAGWCTRAAPRLSAAWRRPAAARWPRHGG
jgi:carboxylate-amine ligase